MHSTRTHPHVDACIVWCHKQAESSNEGTRIDHQLVVFLVGVWICADPRGVKCGNLGGPDQMRLYPEAP